MNSKIITVFIVDDHPLIRQALKASILTETGIQVVGTAKDGAEALEVIPALRPDIAIVDLMMPKVDGLEVITILSQTCPDTHILVLSSSEKEDLIFKVVQAGAKGYLTKNAQHEEMIDAIRTIHAGKTHLPENIMEKFMEGMRQNASNEKRDKSTDSLTNREKEVLFLLGKGCSNSKISENLYISESTVRVYLHQIMKKMNFDNRREAVVFAARLNIDE